MATRGTRAASLRSQPAATIALATSSKSKANPKILVEASDTEASQESVAANVKCLFLRSRLTSMTFSLNCSITDIFFGVRPRRKTHVTGHDAKRANDPNPPLLIFTVWTPIDCVPWTSILSLTPKLLDLRLSDCSSLSSTALASRHHGYDHKQTH